MSHTYDIASRLTGLTFDGQTHASNIVYNAASQTTSLSAGTGTNQVSESYSYNAQTGLLDNQTATRGGTTLLNLSYDYANTSAKRTGQLAKISNNLDHNKDRGYEYDALGRLERATGGQNVNWVQRYNFDRFGNRTDIWSYTASQYVTNFYQNSLNRPPDNPTELQPALSSLQSAYAQGSSQFLTAMQSIGENLFSSQTYANRNRSNHDYVYDLYKAYLNREPDPYGWDAWTAALNSGSTRADVRNGFAQSAEFQLKMKGTSPYSPPNNGVVPADGITAFGFDSTSNRINSAGYSYDAAGNQVRALISSSASQRFQYDAANRLVKVKADDNVTVLATYTYGDSNERLIAEEGSTRTYYVGEGGTTTTEYTEAVASTIPAWSKSYVYLGGRLLSTLTPNGSGGESTEYHHPDRLGTRLVTNPNNGTSFEQVTLPFGTALSAESTGATNKRFTSYDRSATTGLDYAVNRHYDSQQGRFTQVDPIGMRSVSLSSPQMLNLYAYCANDPVNNTDPSGLGFFSFFKKLVKVFKFIAIAVAVAVAVITVVALPGLFAALAAANAAAAAATSAAAAAVAQATLALVVGVLNAIAAVTDALSRVLDLAGFSRASAIFGAISSALGFASANVAGFSSKLDKFFAYFKGATGVGANVANAAGAERVGAWISVVGIAGNVYDFYNAVTGQLEPSYKTIKKRIGGLAGLRATALRTARFARLGTIVARGLQAIPPLTDALSAVEGVLPEREQADENASGAVAAYLRQQRAARRQATSGSRDARFSSLAISPAL